MAKELEFIDVSLGLLRYIKHYPFDFTSAGKCLATVTTTLRLIFIAFTIKMMILHVEDLNTFINGMETLTTDVQGFFKLIVLFNYRRNLQYLLTNLKQFIPNENKYTFWRKCLIGYKNILYLTYVVCILRCFLTKQLLFICWVPQYRYAFEIIQVTQLFVWTVDVFYVLCVDCFFVSLSILICHQFHLFLNELQTIDRETNVKKATKQLNEFVKRHNFMINYVKCFNEAYNPVLVMQYVCNTYTICIELYILTEREGWGDKLFSLFYMTAILTQLSIYCFPSDEISSSANEIPLYIYSMRWYEKPVWMQKQLTFIIQHAQRPLEMRGANMITMDRRAYVIVFKGALSVYTLIKKVNKTNE